MVVFFRASHNRVEVPSCLFHHEKDEERRQNIMPICFCFFLPFGRDMMVVRLQGGTRSHRYSCVISKIEKGFLDKLARRNSTVMGHFKEPLTFSHAPIHATPIHPQKNDGF
jgi:hypothetical protein